MRQNKTRRRCELCERHARWLKENAVGGAATCATIRSAGSLLHDGHEAQPYCSCLLLLSWMGDCIGYSYSLRQVE
jgi:hypothetical protein